MVLEVKALDRFDSHHLKILSAKSLHQVLALPESCWFASNAPVDALEADPIFLKYLNEKRDARLRPKAIRSAVEWFLRTFRHLNEEAIGGRLELDRINQNSAEGREVLVAARRILDFLEKENHDCIELADLQNARKRLMPEALAAGRVCKNVECSEPCRELIEAILETLEDCDDWIFEKDLDKFLIQSCQWNAWNLERETGDPAEWLPFGEETDDCYKLYSSLVDRIDAFFTLCQLSRISPQIKAMASGSDFQKLSANLGKREDVESLALRQPIAALNSDCVLKLSGALNPFDAARLRRFRERIFVPLFGETNANLKWEQWQEIKAKFAHYDDWMRRQPKGMRSALCQNHRILSAGKDALRALFAQSNANEDHLKSVCLVEKAILFQDHLVAFVNNFVSCPDLFSSTKKAIFEKGTMILDGREFPFCVRVPHRDQHIRRCQVENVFVIYAAVSETEGNVKYEIAAPLIAGLRGNLHEGQWGIFRDSAGREYNAQVTKLLENPVSIRDGFLAPFLRMGRTGFWRKDLGLQKTARADFFLGRFCMNVFALAALGFALAFILKSFAEMDWSHFLWASLGILLTTFLTMFLTIVWRLHHRDLRCLLEGSGWGINLPMRLQSLSSKKSENAD